MSGPIASDTCSFCDEPALPLADSCTACGEPLEWTLELPCPECEMSTDHLAGSCHECDSSLGPWTALRMAVLEAETDILVAKGGVPHPTESGFRSHIGSLKGQRRDYRYPLGDGSDVHVREYGDRYEVHHDAVSAVDHPIGHLATHAPHYLVGAVGITALALARSGRSRSVVSSAVTPARSRLGRPQQPQGLLDSISLESLRPFR